MKKINIKTIASKAGVSTATVSRVMHNYPGVKEETKKKVLKVASQFNYEINAVASSLRREKTNTLGIIVGNVLSQFYSTLAKAVEDVAIEEGYSLILCNGDDNPQKELKYLRILKANRVDGIILTPTGKNASYIDFLKKSGMQIVLVDRLVPGLENDAVLVDNEKGSYEAIKYLISRGYKRIAIINGFPDRTTGAERLEGYKRALTEANINIDPGLIKTGNFKKRSGINLATELVEADPRPEVIFVTNLDMALGAVLAIKNKGLHIPRDIGILSFDNPDWTQITDPPITTINQPVYSMGNTAAELIIKKINKPSNYRNEPPLIIRLGTHLVIRSSTS
ncbi:MAG: LacI family DNA-binding transcriptional regulator [Actinomycetota bacterium]|nr:LacI family DNA-binding transcriptional regulator [Actinomycetota bacterium]